MYLKSLEMMGFKSFRGGPNRFSQWYHCHRGAERERKK